ncbi:hypothetical protein [Tropicimonas sp. S265A]|uniref:hypothetical protein n=1 Tax=Tropicimonas sp. S265A TaxID=3415134 RepID=UPI003C7E428C
MRPLILILPIVALAACAPDPVGFDKHPVGKTTAAIDNRDAAAQQATLAARRSAPSYTTVSDQMRRSKVPLTQGEAAARAMAERKSRDGIPLSAGGQTFTVSQIASDGQYFLVAHGSGGTIDQSEALKRMADTVTGCAPAGPAYRAETSYAIALTCL